MIVFPLDFNGRSRTAYPHMVINYIIINRRGNEEYEAGWQMSNDTFHQWKKAIVELRDRYPSSQLA
jgi:hypothetical protein